MSIKQQIDSLEKRCKDLESKLTYYQNKINEQALIEKFIFDELFKQGLLKRSPADLEWLSKNSLERMDASLDNMFEITRAEFHMDRYRFAAGFVENKDIADIACGTGYGTNILTQAHAKSIVGIDISRDAINYAKKYHQIENIEFYSCNAHNTPIVDDSLDVVVSFETLEHLSNEDELLGEFKRILKSDGILIVSTPNDWGVNDLSPFHVKSYDYFELLNTLNKHFLVLNVYNQNSGTPNRKENNGQPRGIIETNEQNHQNAECFIAICQKIKG